MDATLHTRDGRYVLYFERHLSHPPEKVWRAITEREHLRAWFPTDLEVEPGVGGRVRWTFAETDDPEVPDGVVTAWEPPHRFAFDLDGRTLRWELRATESGCMLVFTNIFDDGPHAASYATGWETCFEAFEALLDGREPRLSVEYPTRHEEYAALFGLSAGVRTEDGVRFERLLPKPIKEVWDFLVEDADIASTPPLRFTNKYVDVGSIIAVDPPRRLEYASAAGSVRWEFVDTMGGARLTLTHTAPEDPALALAAWQTHIEVLADWLIGRGECWPEGRTEELREQFASSQSPAR